MCNSPISSSVLEKFSVPFNTPPHPRSGYENMADILIVNLSLWESALLRVALFNIQYNAICTYQIYFD